MSNFPLYDNLVKDIPKKDLTVKQKEEFITKVEHIDTTGRDLIFALIQFYRIENEETEFTDELPYKGIRENDGKNTYNLSWTFTDFPIKLRHILYKFILIHMQSIEEEHKRNTT